MIHVCLTEEEMFLLTIAAEIAQENSDELLDRVPEGWWRAGVEEKDRPFRAERELARVSEGFRENMRHWSPPVEPPTEPVR